MKLVVIADDFTGANDTGVQFSKKGFRTVLSVYRAELKINTQNSEIIVVDTESRFDSRNSAYNKVVEAVNLIGCDGMPRIYKKLDSTLRGNIGVEIQAAMDASKINFAIVAPSFPKNGRAVRGGILYVNGVPVDKTEISKDPKTPVTDSFIPGILERETNRKIGHIELDNVRAGRDNLVSKIEAVRKDGAEIIVIDSEKDDDLKVLSSALADIKEDFVISGSAGLAEFLPGNLIIENTDCESRNEKPVFNEGSFVVMAGSVSDVLRKQIEHGILMNDFEVIDLDLEKVLRDMQREEIEGVIEKVQAYALQNKNIIIRSAGERNVVDRAIELGKEKGLSSYDVSEKIARFFGILTKRIYSMKGLKGLMLSGGDVAIKAATALEIEGIIIKDEILPGIPYGYFTGVDNLEIPVITKAGAFGKEDALVEILNYLR